MPKKAKGGKGGGSKFGKLFGGAVGAGYPNDEAAAMAYKKISGKESLEPSAEKRLKEAFKAGRKGLRGR